MSEPSQPPGATLSALVVDDDPASRLLLCRMLERRGMAVNVCGSADIDESKFHRETLVIARSVGGVLDSSGLRSLLKRVHTDPGPEVDRSANRRPLLLAIRDDIDTGSLEGSAAFDSGDVFGWDETFIGPIDAEILENCGASIDRWLAEQDRLERAANAALAPDPESAPAAAQSSSPFEVEVDDEVEVEVDNQVEVDNEVEVEVEVDDEVFASPFELATVERDASAQAFAEGGLTWEVARTTADQAPIGIVVFDAEEEVVYANKRHADLLGISVTEAGGISAWLAAACPEESYAEKVCDLWRYHIWQKQLTRTFTLKSHDEKLKEIEFRPRLLNDGGLLVMLCDVTEARRSQDAAKIIQAKFEAVFANLPIAVAMVDRSGRFFDFNPAFERLMVCPRLDLLCMSLDECLAEGEAKKLRALEQAVEDRPGEEAGELTEVLQLVAHDGTERHVEFSVSAPEEAPAGGFLRSYFLRDVSEEKIIRKRLRASQEQNRALLEAIPDAVVLLDRHGHINDLVLPPTGALSGDPAQWVGRDLSEVLPGFGGSDFLSVGEVIRSGEARQFSFSMPAATTADEPGRGGDYSRQASPVKELHFDVSVVRCGADHAVAIIHDATLSIEGDLALRREVLLGEHLQDAVMVCSPRGRIEDWNRAAQRVFGYRRHEILGCGLSKLYAPQGAAAFNLRLSRELNEHGRWSAETEFVHKDGTTSRCEVLFLPIERDGVPVSLIGIHRPLP